MGIHRYTCEAMGKHAIACTIAKCLELLEIWVIFGSYFGGELNSWRGESVNFLKNLK